MSDVPGSAPVLDFGLGHKTQAVSAGGAFTTLAHACAVLDDATLRCWGRNAGGELGYGTTTDIGDNEFAGAGGPVLLGAGRTVAAIAAGDASTCALLDDGAVRCWGLGTFGRLGNGATVPVGDNELPGSVAPVALGGALIGSIGDASLTLAADAPQRLLGEVVVLTAALDSSGLDAVLAPAVRIQLPAGLQLLDATPSAGSFAGDLWTLASLPPGQRATLAIRARVDAAGALVSGAELLSTGPAFRDTDSTPGNGVAGEDDQATVSVTGVLPAVPLPAVPPPAVPGVTPVVAPPRNVAPVLSRVSLSRRLFGVGPKRTAVASRRRGPPRGARLRFTLSERATVRVRIQRLVRGRRSGRRCVSAKRAKPRARTCTRALAAGTLKRSRLARGRRSIAFSGRVGRRALRAGRYWMTLTATDAQGLSGKRRKLGFKIWRR